MQVQNSPTGLKRPAGQALAWTRNETLTCFVFSDGSVAYSGGSQESEPMSMSKQRSESGKGAVGRKRRRFMDEFKAEAVQMLFDGHTAASAVQLRPLLQRRTLAFVAGVRHPSPVRDPTGPRKIRHWTVHEI
jgi:hypothetical protein